jgi:sulfite reductase alpha subunit-like flavoprotein
MKPIEFQCHVKSFKKLTPTVFETSFETHQPLPFDAGQFVSVIIPGAGPNGRDLRRAYSIASSPEAGQIELCVKLVEDGPGTQYLYRLRPGDQLRALAPYGTFVFENKPGRNICFVATGTGIAPFRSMILSRKFQENQPPRGFCLLGVRSEDEVLYSDVFGAIPNMEFVAAVSQPSPEWNGFRGRVTDYLRNVGSDFPWLETEFYLCGHGGMITEVKSLLAAKGVSKESVHQEIYYK